LDTVNDAKRINNALVKLRESRGYLLFARLAALDAQLWLAGQHDPISRVQDAGPRAKRAAELCGLISDAVTHAERLIFSVEGDDR
jgi:hypothetical protein